MTTLAVLRMGDEVFETLLRLHPRLKDRFFLNAKEENAEPCERNPVTIPVANAGCEFDKNSGGPVKCFSLQLRSAAA